MTCLGQAVQPPISPLVLTPHRYVLVTALRLSSELHRGGSNTNFLIPGHLSSDVSIPGLPIWLQWAAPFSDSEAHIQWRSPIKRPACESWGLFFADWEVDYGESWDWISEVTPSESAVCWPPAAEGRSLTEQMMDSLLPLTLTDHIPV